MTERAPASLAQALPYWDILQLPTADVRQPEAAFLLLKDGSIALGLESLGVDLTGASSGQIDSLVAQWARTFVDLPADAFVQCVFATGGHAGGSYHDLINAFSQRSDAGAHALLRRGRAEQAQALHRQTSLVRARLTYWFGLRAGVANLLRPMRKPQQRQAAWAQLAEVSQTLYAFVARTQVALRGQGLKLNLLDAAAVEQQLQVAVAPTQAARAPVQPVPGSQATPCWDAPRLCERLARQSFAAAPDHLLFAPTLPGDAATQVRMLGMHELPASTEASMLHAMLFEFANKAPLRVVVTHEKVDPVLQRSRLQQRRKLLFALMGRYFLNHDAKQAYEQTEEVLVQMAQNNAQVLRTSLAVCVGPADAHTQTAVGRQVMEATSRRGIALHACEHLQLPAWLGSLPGYGYAFPLKYHLLQLNAAHLTPVFLPSQGDACPDLLLGNRQGGVSKLSIRLGERHDASALVIGKTGSGKTFLFSWLAKYGCLDLGGHVVVADNKGPKNSSYKPLCELLGGQYVHLEHDDSISFSPFPEPHEVCRPDGSLDEGRLEGLESILFMMTEDPRSTLHPDYAKNVMRRLVHALYAERPARHEAPRLGDAVRAARNLRFDGEALQITAKSVAERLQLWCEDPVRRRLFDTPRRAQTQNPLTVFDFHGFTRDSYLAAVLISVLAQRIELKMNHLPRDTPKLFAFDEAWAMFDGSAEATSLLNRLYRTARSYGACVYTLTQSHHDIAHSAAAQGILANVGLVYLMRHQEGHGATASAFRLNEAQTALFAGLQMVPGEFAESLVLDALEGRTRVLRYAPTSFDLWCDTSRADDVAMRSEALQQTHLGLEQTIVALARLCPRGAPAQPWQRQQALAALRAEHSTKRAS